MAPYRTPQTDYDIGIELIEIRPTLIVGMGGTGVLAVKWVNALMRRMFGSVPPFVKLIAIDSDVITADGPAESFPESDFYNVFDDIHLGDVVRDFSHNPSCHRHLQWLRELDLPSAVTERGCQGISRLGRVAFYESSYRSIYPAIIERMEALGKEDLKNIVRDVRPGRYRLGRGSLVCHMIGSLCGGTGSGMLLDLAYAIREWSKSTFHRPSETIAHLALAEAFNLEIPQVVDKLKAVAGTMLQQIEFLMDHRRPDLKMLYPNGEDITVPSNIAPFSSCYLLNGYGPEGGGTIRELCEMIARMIVAMTVEPACKEVFADVNNKQLDILSKKDRCTKRTMCFSSYGLRYGTSNALKDEEVVQFVKYLVCREIGKMERRIQTKSQGDEKLKDKVQKSVRGPFETEAILNEMKDVCPQFSYVEPTYEELERLNNSRNATRILFDQQLEHFKDKQILASIKKNAIEKVRPRVAQVKAAIDSLLGDELLPYHAAATYHRELEKLQDKFAAQLKKAGDANTAWEKGVVDRISLHFDEIRRDLPPEENDDSAVIELALKRLLEGLEDPREDGLHRIVSKQFATLKQIVVFEVSLDAIQSLLKLVEGRLERIKLLAKAAGSLYLQLKRGATDVREGKFATPFVELEPPDVLLERYTGRIEVEDETQETERNVVENLNQQFENLVQAVVRDFLNPEEKSDKEDPDGRKFLMELLEEDEIDERPITEVMKSWFGSYHNALMQILFIEVDPTNPSGHRFFPIIREMTKRSEPKVALDNRGRHSPTMKTVVVQHATRNHGEGIQDSCVPELIKIQEGEKCRLTPTTDDYARLMDNWFQFMYFKFGFCVPALDNFDGYTQARERYLEPLLFDERDLWLDPKWYEYHREMMQSCEDSVRTYRQEDDFKRNVASKQTAKQARSAIKDYHQQFQEFFRSAIATCEKFDFPEMKQGMDCISILRLKYDNGSRDLKAGSEQKDEDLSCLAEVIDPVQEQVKNMFINVLQPRFPVFAEGIRTDYVILCDQCDRILRDFDLPMESDRDLPSGSCSNNA